MLRLLLHWVLSALALILVAKVVPGFYVSSIGAALIGAVVLGLLNATVGFVLKIVTLPISILTLGIFIFVINAIVIKLASGLVRGFTVTGFVPAFVGAIVLALLHMVIEAIMD